MKISLNWLNTYLDRPVDPQEVDRLMTDQGFPLEEREDFPNDIMLDLEVTSNRPDCLAHLGVAREIAAGSGRTVKEPDCSLPTEDASESADQLTSVEILNTELCPVYTARVIRGVKVGPSPKWLVDYLETLGLRSVNNIVDISNFVMLELGQPLHTFDMDKLIEGRIVVRTAKPGETFEAIDGTKHRLREDMLVIADAKQAVAIGGVMGGLDSEVGNDTTNILLEAAMFTPLQIRRTSRALKLASDASFRFERGVDPLGVDLASKRCAQLIVELAGGTLAKGVVRTGIGEPSAHTVDMRVDRCNHLLGTELSTDQILEYFTRLNFKPVYNQTTGVITSVIPSYRLDLEREADMIEEAGRLYGFENLDVNEKIHIVARSKQPHIAAKQQLIRSLAAHGFFETINFSFLTQQQGEMFLTGDEKPLMIVDDRRKAEPMLRPSVIPSLLNCRKINQDGGNAAVKIFETAAVWARQNDGGEIIERNRLGILCDVNPGTSPDETLRDLRGTIEETVHQLLGDVDLAFTPATVANCAAAADVKIADQSVGYIGVVDGKTQDAFNLQTQVVVGDLDLPALLGSYPPERQVAQLPKFPGIVRDLSVIVDEPVLWSDIESNVLEAKPALMEDVKFLMVYRGKQIEKGRKSVSFRMLFRDPDKTLRHDEVDPQVETVVARLKDKLKVELRA